MQFIGLGVGGGDGFVGQLLEMQRGFCTPSHEGSRPHLCGHQQTEARRCQEDSDGVVGVRLMGAPCLEAGGTVPGEGEDWVQTPLGRRAVSRWFERF